MNLNENHEPKISIYPKKITSAMDIHRQRFSQFKQRPIITLHPSPPIYCPQSSRPQPRQQARSKEQTKSPLNRYTNSTRNPQYITLANLSKIFHVIQTRDNKINDNSDTATDTSVSTTTSSKQRVQQHLQQTATRWWKTSRTPDPPIIETQEINNQFPSLVFIYISFDFLIICFLLI